VLAVATRLWPGARVSVELLAGGITNENFKVTVGAGSYVVRLFAPGAELLLIDRAAECEITAAVARLGVGPEVVATLPDQGALVTRFIEGRRVTAEQMAERDVLRQVVRALRLVHAEADAPKVLDPFRDISSYSGGALSRGVETHPDFSWGTGLAREVQAPVGYSSTALCHGDLLNANFIQATDGIHIVDWEYAGQGDPLFDLANLSINHRFSPDDDAILLELYQGHADEVNLARIRVLRFVSAVREAAWSYLQAAISPLDVDFTAYADGCLDTMRQAAAEPSFADALRLLRRSPAGGPAS
jgi:thiamine kinase-like enzyme